MPLLVLLLTSWLAVTAQPTTAIKVDQVGYLPGTPKVAIVVSDHSVTDFTVRRARDAAVAFRGKLSAQVADRDSGDLTQAADFTRLSESGTYYIEVAGVGSSWVFVISPTVYARPFYLACRAFYGQRCGMAVDLGPEFPGYAHAACHLNGAYHPSSGKAGPHISAKGWHDAGDYGRYVVNSGIATGTLLWTWEMFSARLKNLSLNLPESGNRIPDILDEIRWNLDWMLAMQDEDGGVWQKQTSEQFAGFVMPEKDNTVSEVIGTGAAPYKSSCATADLAAVMAIAARAYQPFDSRYAQKCLRAAHQAWNWLERYPNVLFRNPAGVETGGYGDRDCGDERLWAAAELWRTTGGDVFHQYFLEHFGEYRNAIRADRPPSWANVAPLALWTYVLGRGKSTAAVAAIRQDTLKAADEIVERANHNPYRISLTAKDYIWGSNGVVANYGLQLLVAHALQPDPRYQAAALENLHYLLGRNTFSLSFVSQVGANPFQHPHHRPSEADGQLEPWPGLLSGGPNRGRQDAAMKLMTERPSAKMYLDEWQSYASNEVAINWNAPLVFLLAGVLSEK